MENYIVSARKYRPATFDTVVGQRALTITLKNAIANHKRSLPYLFCGPRGVGKTTCARIFAKTINCLSPLPDGEACNECESCRAFNEQRSYNIHELDAASNNSVEDIRSLIEQVRVPPQVGKYKVYIIDEVHMLSASAFNAFLKTLEEPPAHAIFILATTEKHKILPTILSRCQIYDFSRISVADIVEHLEHVAASENIEAEPEALNVIAQKADGGMRDALSIFDQVVSFTNGHVAYKSVIENLNVLDYEYYFKLTDCFLQNRVGECLLIFNEVLKKGFDGNHFVTGLTSHFRDLLVGRDEQTLQLLEVGASIRERYRVQAQQCTPQFLYKAMKLSNECDINYRMSRNKRLLVELMLIQIAQLTLPDEDVSGGRSPEQKIKPVFSQAASQQPNVAPQQPTVAQQPSNVAPATAAPHPAASVQLQAAPQPQASAPVHTSPLPKRTDSGTKIPVMKAGSLGGISIRQMSASKNTSASTTTETQQQKQAVAEAQSYQNKPVQKDELDRCWRQFSTTLPIEEKANAQRMMNMHPVLKEDGVTFEVVVDNGLVEKYMSRLAPQIEAYLRENLHNYLLRMTLRVSEAGENLRPYSQVECFQMMSKKNPELLRMKEAFGLELA